MLLRRQRRASGLCTLAAAGPPTARALRNATARSSRSRSRKETGLPPSGEDQSATQRGPAVVPKPRDVVDRMSRVLLARVDLPPLQRQEPSPAAAAAETRDMTIEGCREVRPACARQNWRCDSYAPNSNRPKSRRFSNSAAGIGASATWIVSTCY